MSARDAIREALEKIAAKNGGLLTPQNVITHARSKASPLHGCFTWDDSAAADMQRLHEAREVIRSVRITVVVNDTIHRTIAYVRDPAQKSDSAGYRATSELRTDADVSREVMLAEFGRAEAAMRRALDVASALNLSEEVGEPLRAIRALKDRVEHMTMNA
jgi:hypothetical protein